MHHGIRSRWSVPAATPPTSSDLVHRPSLTTTITHCHPIRHRVETLLPPPPPPKPSGGCGAVLGGVCDTVFASPAAFFYMLHLSCNQRLSPARVACLHVHCAACLFGVVCSVVPLTQVTMKAMSDFGDYLDNVCSSSVMH